LGAALAAGQLGGSFGWQQRHDGGTYRWYCLERPMRREILSATIRELTICCRGAFESTWVTTVGPGLAAKWRRLAMHHVTPRPSARPLTW